MTLEMRIGGTDKLWELNLRHGSLTGQPAVEASRVGEFYLALTPTHELSLAQVGGKELMAPFQLNGALNEPHLALGGPIRPPPAAHPRPSCVA